MRTGRVTRVAEFGAFVELEPAVEGLAHASTFPPTGRSGGWSRSVAVGMTGGVRDPEHRSREEADRRRAGRGRLVARGLRRRPSKSAIVPGARLTGKVERHETFGVFVFLAPGRTGLMPLSETGIGREATSRRRFPSAPTSRWSSSRSTRRAGAFVSASRRSLAARRSGRGARVRRARARRASAEGSDRSPTSSAARSAGARNRRRSAVSARGSW